MCVCVCVCDRETEIKREAERGGGAEGQRQAEEAERERQDGAYWAVCGAERRVERGEKGLSEALKPVPPLGSGSQSPET